MLSMYQNARQYDKAMELGQKLIAEAKNDAEKRGLVYQVVQIMFSAGKKAEAGAWLQQNFPKENANIYDLSSYAMMLDQAGLANEADDALTKAAAAAKTPMEKAQCQMRMADTWMRRQQWAKAEEVLKNVLNDCKDIPSVVQQATMTLERLKRMQQAPAPPVPPKVPAQQVPPEGRVPAQQPVPAQKKPLPEAVKPPAPPPEQK